MFSTFFVLFVTNCLELGFVTVTTSSTVLVCVSSRFLASVHARATTLHIRNVSAQLAKQRNFHALKPVRFQEKPEISSTKALIFLNRSHALQAITTSM